MAATFLTAVVSTFFPHPTLVGLKWALLVVFFGLTVITNADGSVDMHLQAESPGKAKEANWLPAPKGKFALVMRMYWPTTTPPSIVDGTWTPPGAKRVD